MTDRRTDGQLQLCEPEKDRVEVGNKAVGYYLLCDSQEYVPGGRCLVDVHFPRVHTCTEPSCREHALPVLIHRVPRDTIIRRQIEVPTLEDIHVLKDS